jgi:phage baseplate assembly protein W
VPQNITHRYSDFNLSFVPNPVTKDIGMLFDADSVKQSVINLVLSKHYSRPFHPEIGCSVTALLFENISSITSLMISKSIEDVLANFEPRVQLQSIDVQENSTENGYNVSITYFILNFTESQTVTMFLQRLR